MPTFQRSYRLLNFELCVTSNQSQILTILDENYYNSALNHLAPLLTSFNYFVEVTDQPADNHGRVEDMQLNYDSSNDSLLLTFLNGNVKVVIDYSRHSVHATLPQSALNYRAALANWLLTIPFADLIREWGYYFMHAACLEYNNQAIAFAGKSGSGKTTLSLGLLTQGWFYLTDDEAFLAENNGFQIYGALVRVKLSYHTWSLFSQYLGASQSYRGKRLYDLSEHFSSRLKHQSNLIAVCLISPADTNELQLLKPIEAFQELLNLAFLPTRPIYARANFNFLSNLALHLPVYRLNFSTDFAHLNALLQKEIIKPNA